MRGCGLFFFSLVVSNGFLLLLGRRGWGGQLTNKHLPDTPTRRETQHIPPDSRVPGQKVQRGRELAGLPRGGLHAEPLADGRVDEPGAQDEVAARDGGREQVVGRHHLGARVGLEGLEDVVLGAVGQAVEQQVDGQEQHAPGGLARVGGRRGGLVLLLAARVEGEDGDAAGDGGDDEVLVQGVALAEEGDVQEHDGQQLAALGEDVGDVVDVVEGGVAEGGGQGVCEGDEEQRGQDAAVGDHGRHGLALGRHGDAEELAAGRGEEGLDGQQEDGELEPLALGPVTG